MSGRSLLLGAVILGFGVLTTLALMDVGYMGIVAPHFRSWSGAQVFADLVIVCVLACRWMRDDARAHGMSPWPFIAITLVAGSFGPLLYLLVREVRAASSMRPATA